MVITFFFLFGNNSVHMKHMVPSHPLAVQNCLPYKIICMCNFPQSDLSKRFFKSFSVWTTDFPLVRSHLCANLWIWVSTGNVSIPKAWFKTTDAVLCPTPGRSSNAFISFGTLELCWSFNISEVSTIALVFLGASPQLFM